MTTRYTIITAHSEDCSDPTLGSIGTTFATHEEAVKALQSLVKTEAEEHKADDSWVDGDSASIVVDDTTSYAIIYKIVAVEV